MADIVLVSATARTLTCLATDLPSGARVINWYICLPGDEETKFPYNGDRDIYYGDGWTEWTFTYIGKPTDSPSTWVYLQPNTRYAVKIAVFDARDGTKLAVETRYFTTAATDRPSNWAWESNVASGAAFSMTAAEWNRFIDRIFAFAAYKSLSTAVSPSTYYVEQGTEMLASEVNKVRALINAISPPTAPPSPVSSGDTITAAFFNDLKNSLNSIT